jgi:RNA polymerase sigma-70 factor (ECF subfamily)
MSIPEAPGLPIIGGNVRATNATERNSKQASTSEPSDEVLLARIQAGGKDAASVLFTRYSRAILSIAMQVLQDVGEAEDLVQEVFLFILNKCKLFDSAKGAARAWILQVTYHRAYDRRRYLSARGFYDHAELNPAILSSSTEEDVEIQMALRLSLRPAVEQLAAEQRRVLDLYFGEGYSIREICEELEQSKGNVQHHLYRGIEKVRSYMFDRKDGPKKIRIAKERTAS